MMSEAKAGGVRLVRPASVSPGLGGGWGLFGIHHLQGPGLVTTSLTEGKGVLVFALLISFHVGDGRMGNGKIVGCGFWRRSRWLQRSKEATLSNTDLPGERGLLCSILFLSF